MTMSSVCYNIGVSHNSKPLGAREFGTASTRTSKCLRVSSSPVAQVTSPVATCDGHHPVRMRQYV